MTILIETSPVLTPDQRRIAEWGDGPVVGIATRSRMSVSNFPSFCRRILTETAADAGLPPRPEVLDGIAQVLLLKDIRPQLSLVYHSDWWLGSFVQFINRAKDELVSPDD